jgi:hypothetical protein
LEVGADVSHMLDDDRHWGVILGDQCNWPAERPLARVTPSLALGSKRPWGLWRPAPPAPLAHTTEHACFRLLRLVSRELLPSSGVVEAWKAWAACMRRSPSTPPAQHKTSQEVRGSRYMILRQCVGVSGVCSWPVSEEVEASWTIASVGGSQSRGWCQAEA